jgi:hypothetical protein
MGSSDFHSVLSEVEIGRLLMCIYPHEYLRNTEVNNLKRDALLSNFGIL